MKFSVGCDSGMAGSLAIVDENFQLVKWWDMPVIQNLKGKNEIAVSELVQILNDIKQFKLGTIEEVMLKVWVETQQAMPAQGVSSTFKIGRNFGLIEGAVSALGLSYDYVHPRVWSKVMLKDVPSGDGKFRSFTKAQRLFPDLPLMKPKGKVLSMDGRADAALIAYYGMLQMRGVC